jgi:hypothetical protein
MSKLYGPDEGYQTKINRGTLKRFKKRRKITKVNSSILLELQGGDIRFDQ